MIEQALLNYVTSSTVGTSVSSQVYYSRVPSGVTMPWIYFKVADTQETRITQYNKMEADVLINFFVEDSNQFRGRETAEALKLLLQNFRGDMTPEKDILIRCEGIRDQDGPLAAFSYIIPTRVVYCYYPS